MRFAAYALLSAGMIWIATNRLSSATYFAFSVLFLIFCFTRTDVALLIGLVAGLFMGLGYIWLSVIVVFPVLCQIYLSKYLFTESEYYSEIFMLVDNISLIYFINNPVIYLIAGALLFYREKIKNFLIFARREYGKILFLLVGYAGVVFL